MAEFLIRFSIQNKLLVGLFILALIGGGIFSLTRLPIDAVPDITNNQVQIVTTTPSLAPQEMEQFVTFPIEMAMANIQGVTEIRSVSKFGLSVVTVVFDDDVPVLDARQLVSEQIKAATDDIPEGYGSPEMMPITTGLGEIFQFTLQVDPAFADQYDAMELRSIQDWIVKRYLAGIPGIVEISSFGGYLKQYEVSLDPDRLRALDVSIGEVYAALAANNQNSGGSYIEKGPDAFYIRTEGVVTEKAQIEGILVKNTGGIPLRIADVGTVNFGYMPRFGAMTQDGKGEAVGGITLMYKGANSNNVIARVKERLEKVESVLPEGVHIAPFLDRADLVGRTIGTVSKNLAEGGLIVVFVLVLLLGNLRAGLIVATVIPLSMLFAFMCMDVFGVSANLMSLGAIDFGLVVDGAVIVVEAAVHRFHTQLDRRALSQKEMDQLVGDAAVGIRKSAGFPEFIILMVYLPILTLEGIEGKMFLPMAQTVGFAILGALILSMTYVPMVSALALSKKHHRSDSFAERLMDFLRRGYEPFLRGALRRPKAVVAGAVVAFSLSLVMFLNMGGEFLPDLEEGDLAMQMTIPAGSALSQSVVTATRAEKILLENFPQVKHVVSKIGTAEVPTDPMSVEDADVMIVMKDPSEWPEPKTRAELVGEMKEALSAIPEASFEFTQPIQLRFNELLTGAKADVAVKIFGEDLAKLAELGREAEAIIRKVPGAADVKLEVTEGFPQMTVTYDRIRLAQHGLSVADVNQDVQAAFAGLTAGVVFEGEKRFDLVVRLDPAHRQSIESLQQLPVRSAAGFLVPLRELGTIQLQEGPMQVSREDAKRRIAIGVNVRNRDVESLVTDIESRLKAELKLPPGYAVVYGGEFQNLQSAKQRLAIAVPVALVIICILLFLTFQSWKLTLIIFSAVPMAAIGGVLALALRGMPFSISAGIGFIALFGVAVLNGVVMIGQYNTLKAEGISDLRERILVGSGTRLRPVLMTAAVASLGFLPMALSASAGAEVQRPLATVVIGGLISSTLLTLLVLPALYLLTERPRTQRKPKPPRKPLEPSAAMMLALALSVAGVRAQGIRPLPLAEAESLALTQSAGMRLRQLETARARELTATAWDIPRTNVQLQRGQINAEVRDNFWTLSQSLGNPFEMRARKATLLREMDLAQTAEAIESHRLRYELRSLYQTWGYVQARQRLLDSLAADLSEAARLAALRYETGDAPLIVRSAVAARAAEAQALAQQELSYVATMRIQLQQLLYSTETVEPAVTGTYLPLTDTGSLLNQPVLAAYAARKALAIQTLRERKAALAPGINGGVFLQSLELQPGFNGFQAGIEIPLAFGADKARIKAAQTDQQIAELEAEWAAFRLENLRAEIRTELDRGLLQLAWFEDSGLSEARLQSDQGRLLWQNGEIPYYEYLALVQDAYRIRLRYLEAVHSFNQTLLELQFVPSFN
jgi:cobalt-zinc-cadmium resistance protein CzcA